MSNCDKLQVICDYLKHNLPNRFITKAFIFGSLAQQKERPNDCDLFIVTNVTPADYDYWKKFLNELEGCKTQFLSKFNLPLNISVNTVEEFNEGSEFKRRILSKQIVELKLDS